MPISQNARSLMLISFAIHKELSFRVINRRQLSRRVWKDLFGYRTSAKPTAPLRQAVAPSTFGRLTLATGVPRRRHSSRNCIGEMAPLSAARGNQHTRGGGDTDGDAEGDNARVLIKNALAKRAVRPGPALAAGIAQGDLPRHCAVGTKRNAKGHTISWIGYKLHLDIADGDVPISP
jgi:hypothetical protein